MLRVRRRFFIARGSVRIFKVRDRADAEKRGALSMAGEGDIEIAELHAGSFFGEKALLERATRNASVAAKDECELLVLATSDYEHIASLNASMRRAELRGRARPLGALRSPGKRVSFTK